MELFELTKMLCDLPGVAGREAQVGEAIAKIARQYTDDVTMDALGNVIARKKGKKTPDKPIMLAAHMDEVGFMVNGIGEDGLLRLVAVGGLYGQTLAGRVLYFPRTGVKGVLGKAPVHLTKDKDAVPDLDDLYVDIGAKDKEEAQKHIRLGDCAVFDAQAKDFGEDMLMGKALDDRLGCAILLMLMQKDLPVDVVFTFTVQEELGLRGAQTAAFAVRPGIGIVVDVAGAADNAGFMDTANIALCGKGPVISFADAATAYDIELFGRVCDAADKNGIPWQTKTRISGGTDAGAIHRAAEGARVIGVSVAGRNIHTAASAISKTDAQNAVVLIEKILENIADVW